VCYEKEQKAGTPKAELFFRLSLICFLLGIMSKPMVVTLPCVLLLLDFWPLSRIADGGLLTLGGNADGDGQTADWKARGIGIFNKSGLKKLLVEKLPFFGLTLISSLITLYNVKAA